MTRTEMTRAAVVVIAGILLTASSAWASHPERYRRDRYRTGNVQAVAHELEQATRHLYYKAESARGHYGGSDSWVLKRLRELEAEARHFHRQVERRGRTGKHTRRDYRDLEDAFYRATRAVGSLHGYRHLQRDFERVDYLMRELEAAFDQRTARRRHLRWQVVLPRFYWFYR